MAGEPLRLAREACAAVVRNLRPDDLFTLVVFDNSAQVVVPLQKPVDRHGMIAAIEQIADRGSTNLMAGWLLGRDELLKAGTECDKKILVLTDGHLNEGITEPDRVEALTRSGFGKDGIRTGCLGFGNSYESLRKISSRSLTARDLKDLVYESRYYTRSSSHALYTGSRKKPKSRSSGDKQQRQPEQ
jgi:Ca-activated chloride channel family protein